MVVEFWSFSKRHNSTKKPSVDGTRITFVYKDATDLHNPIIEISRDASEFNYAKIGDIYFFIESVQTVAKNLWNVSLKIDLLATYKREIQNTGAMVVYTSSIRNPSITDERIIPLPDYNQEVFSFALDNVSIPGTYFVRAIGKTVGYNDAYNCGLSPLYMLDYQALKTFVDGVTVDNVIESLKNWFTNSMDGFIDCYWMPFNILGNYAHGEPSSIKIGGASIDCGAYVVLDSLSSFPTKTKEIPIPWIYDDFRNNEPYTALFIYTPWTGVTKLNTSDFYGANKVTVNYALDIFSGDITFNIQVGERIVATLSGNAKITLPISQATVNVGGMLSGITTTAGGFTAAGLANAFMKSPKMAVASGIASAVAGIFGGIASAAQSEVVSKGNMSGSVNAATFGSNIKIFVVAQSTLVDPINNASIVGYPLGAVRTLQDLTGFVQTAGASVSASAYESEIIAINKLLDGGVYIE